MALHWFDIAILVSYFLFMAWIGFHFAKKNNNTEEYFLGGRSFAGWVIGLSLVGTSISSVTFLAYPADAFKVSWIRYIPNFALPIGALVSAYVFLPFFRRNKVTSAYEYLEERFSISVRLYAAACFIIAQMVRVCLILYLVSLLIHEMTGFNITMSIIIAGVLVSVYTIVGGIDAVIWTDVIQTIILLLGGIIVLAIIIHLLPGGFSQIISEATAAGKFSFNELTDGKLEPISWGFSLTKKTALMIFMLGLFAWLTEYSSNQCTVQRYCASRSTKDARQAMLVCVLSSLPIWAFYMFLGTSLFVFFKVFPSTEAAQMLDGTRKAEQILPFFIMNHMPLGVRGIVIAAALAAAMSSLDSSINSISTVTIVDIYKRIINKNAADKQYLKMAKLTGIVVSVLMITGSIALAKSDTKTLQDTGTILCSIVGGGLFGIFALGFFTKVGDAFSIWVGIVSTVIFTTWTLLAQHGHLPQAITVPFDLYYTMIVGNLVMFFVSFFAAAIFRRTTKNLKGLTIWSNS